MTDRSYKALETYGGIYFIAGILLLIMGILAGIAYTSISVWIGLFIIVITIFLSLPLLAFSSFVDLMINLERNTHDTAKYLRELVHTRKKIPLASKTGFICNKCSFEVEHDDVMCKGCLTHLGVKGAVRKVKKK